MNNMELQLIAISHNKLLNKCAITQSAKSKVK